MLRLFQRIPVRPIYNRFVIRGSGVRVPLPAPVRGCALTWPPDLVGLDQAFVTGDWVECQRPFSGRLERGRSLR
jgi:hypothetical protein